MKSSTFYFFICMTICITFSIFCSYNNQERRLIPLLGEDQRESLELRNDGRMSIVLRRLSGPAEIKYFNIYRHLHTKDEYVSSEEIYEGAADLFGLQINKIYIMRTDGHLGNKGFLKLSHCTYYDFFVREKINKF